MPYFLGTELPERFPPLLGDFDLRPRQLQSWLAGLPLADVDEVSRTLRSVLRETSALEHSAEVRLGFLSSLEPVLEQLGRALSRRLGTEHFPLSARAVHTAELLIEIQYETAVGYLCAAHSLVQAQAEGTELPFSLLRAIRSFGLCLLTSYQAHLPHTAGAWRACHRIHRFAEEHGLTAPFSAPQTELQKAYKQVLLLGAADPHRFRQDELKVLFEAIEPHAQSADLSPVAAVPSGAAVVFVVDPDADHGPVRRELWRRPELLGETHRMLSVGPVRAALLDATTPEIEPVIRTVAQHWTRIAERGTRVSNEGTFELLLGMRSIHAALMDGTGTDTLSGLFNSARFLKEDEAAGGPAPPAGPQLWRSRDLSTRGLRLSRTLANDLQGLQVGALAGVRESGAPGSYRLCTVRWFRADPTGHVESGLELIDLEQPQPVAIQPDGSEPQRALQVHHPNGAEDGPFLLLPGNRFRPAQSMWLITPSGRERVEIERIVPHAVHGFTVARVTPSPDPEAH